MHKAKIVGNKGSPYLPPFFTSKWTK